MITVELTQYQAKIIQLALENNALLRERRGHIVSAAEERRLALYIDDLFEAAKLKTVERSEPEAGGRSPLSNVSEPVGP